MAVELWFGLTISGPGQPAIAYAGAAIPAITIFDPTGAAQLTGAAMVNEQNGYWSYTFPTPASPTAAQLGVWTAEVTITDGVTSGSVCAPLLQEPTPIFQLV
ncbi:MAG: hypothetical protein IVW56_04575 [Candidatus Binataceae bacterium]|nr:hypothetical protein [Candidatus Binataceae bacterium]